MRILLVAPFNSRKYRGPMFHFFGRRLANGFTRNGHFVVNFSDRDSVKNTLGIRKLGAILANRQLIEMAEFIRPDLVCVHSFDLISASTIREIRALVPGCRVAVVYIDTLLRPEYATRFGKEIACADVAFATTGGNSLARFSRVCPVAFIPNIVDTSVDTARAFAEPTKSVDVLFCATSTGPADRWKTADELRKLQPDLRFGYYGRNRQDRIFGAELMEALKQAKVGLNLNQYEGDLYASDRMGQYLGNGLLLATNRASGFSSYFGDEEMIFFDDAAELARKVARAVGDESWRTMAERSHKKAVSAMSETAVTDFICRVVFGEPLPETWIFRDQLFR